jgi:hypothetical protein
MNNTPDTQPEEWAVRRTIFELWANADSAEEICNAYARGQQWFGEGISRATIDGLARSYMQLRGEVKQECEAIAMEEAEASTWTKDTTPNAVGSLIAYRIRTQHKPRNLHTKQQ